MELENEIFSQFFFFLFSFQFSIFFFFGGKIGEGNKSLKRKEGEIGKIR